MALYGAGDHPEHAQDPPTHIYLASTQHKLSKKQCHPSGSNCSSYGDSGEEVLNWCTPPPPPLKYILGSRDTWFDRWKTVGNGKNGWNNGFFR